MCVCCALWYPQRRVLLALSMMSRVRWLAEHGTHLRSTFSLEMEGFIDGPSGPPCHLVVRWWIWHDFEIVRSLVFAERKICSYSLGKVSSNFHVGIAIFLLNNKFKSWDKSFAGFLSLGYLVCNNLRQIMVERSKIPHGFIALLHGLCVFGSLETAGRNFVGEVRVCQGCWIPNTSISIDVNIFHDGILRQELLHCGSIWSIFIACQWKVMPMSSMIHTLYIAEQWWSNRQQLRIWHLKCWKLSPCHEVYHDYLMRELRSTPGPRWMGEPVGWNSRHGSFFMSYPCQSSGNFSVFVFGFWFIFVHIVHFGWCMVTSHDLSPEGFW